jgi:predicted secreted hydrolase
MNVERISRRLVLGGLAALPLAGPARAQGFAGMGRTADGFAAPERGHALAFPADLGPHPGFRTEWWYVTANLAGEDGERYGAQWTLFRQALAPGPSGPEWADPHAWMGHAALTSGAGHRFAERLGRGGIGQAGASPAPFRAWIDDWTLQESAPGGIWTMRAAGPDFAFDLGLLPWGPFVAHGDRGYSVKSSNGQASHYFSQPFLEVEGGVKFEDREIAVRGSAWLDREWSSQPLAPGQRGWDWLSLHLDSGDKLMAFALRSDDAPTFHSGTWIAPGGAPDPLTAGGIEMIPGRTRRVAGRRVPVRWRVRVPARGLDMELTPLNPDCWNAGTVPYWEGPVFAEGTHRGEGYLEMTGY